MEESQIEQVEVPQEADAPEQAATEQVVEEQKADEKDVIAEKLSSGMATLVRRERELRAERERLAAEAEKHKSSLSRVQELEKLLAEDPVAALEKMGVDFATLAERTLRGNPEESEVQKLRRELKEKEDAFAERQKKVEAERVAAVLRNAESVIEKGKDDRWELCFQQYQGTTHIASEAMEFARIAYEEGFPAIGLKQGTVLTLEETLDKMEDLISENILKYVDTKRISGKIREKESAKKQQKAKAVEAEKSAAEMPKAATQRSSRVVSGVTRARPISDIDEKRTVAIEEFIRRMRQENGNA